MSEFHYTVIYDSKAGAWSVEPDPFAYYPDGNVYDKYKYLAEGWGWYFPSDENEQARALDCELFRTLQAIVCTFPVPEVNGDLSVEE